MKNGFMTWLVRWGLHPNSAVYYIGGSDVLPPPLKGAEEQSALQALESGDENSKQLLIAIGSVYCP